MTYNSLSVAFDDIKRATTKEVGEIIGGKVQQNIESGEFDNACALRFSYALQKAGLLIRSSDGPNGGVSSGKDRKWYLFRVSDAERLVKNRLSTSKVLSGTTSSDFKGEKGIIVFRNCDWRGQHIDLFNGSEVESHDYSNRCGKVTLYVLS